MPHMKAKKSPKPTPVEPHCILVPVDFSERSLTAVRHALSLAQRYDAQLVLLHVVQEFSGDMLVDTAQTHRAIRAAAHERLTRLADSTQKVWPRTSRELRSGHPVTTILSMVRRTNANLIVMGTHGRTGLKRAFIGSVAERVVRLATCSVLVVR